MPVTSPDNIFYPDTSAAQNQAAYMATHSSSVQSALSARQRYTYVWANDSARNSQLGMTTGSTGYQLDTKTEYKYENGFWRLATPYAEFMSANKTITSDGYSTLGDITINSGLSTSTTFATSSANVITFTDPGIYSISAFTVASVAAGSAFVMLGTSTQATTNFAFQISRGPFANDNVNMLVMPFYRTTAPGSSIYFYVAKPTTQSIAFYSTIRIGRLG